MIRPDVGRMGAGMSQPGIDSRQHAELGTVLRASASDGGGYVARVHLYESDIEVNAAVSMPWAGVSYGAFFDVEVDDKVLVTPVMGHPDAGWVVVARFWEPSTPAPSEVSQRPDVVVLAPAGRRIRIATQGTGDVVIEARGGGKVLLGADSADDPVALKSDWTDWLTALQASIDALNALPPTPATAAAILALTTLQTSLGHLFPACSAKVVAL